MSAIKDITKAIVENGVMKERTLEETVCINGVNYRTDDPGAKQHGIYDYFYEVANPPAGKKAVPNRVIDHAAGMVTDGFLYVDKTADEIKAETNSKLDAQIDALERQQLLPRITRDMHKMVTLQAAAGQGITEADLLSEGNPAYSPGYARFYAFDAEIAALRSQRV